MAAPDPMETTTAASSSTPPQKDINNNNVEDEEPQQRRGVIGWVKGKIQKRNIAANMNNINLDAAEKSAMAATEGGEPTEMDIAMGLGDGGVVLDDDKVADEDKIDLEAENDEGLLVGWGKKLQEVEWVQKTKKVVEEQVANRQEQQELEMYHEKYKDEIKADPEIQALQKKIRKITKNLKVQRLNGDRIGKRNWFERKKRSEELDQKTARLNKAIWTFSNSSMNSHEYAKAMMRASARLQRKGIKVHKSEKALAMEAAVLRNMHRMLAIQKQYSMSKRACNDVESFIKRCKGWLDNKLADGEMGIMVLEATSKSMGIMYQELVEIQDALKPKLEDPANHEFKKERMKTVLALPKGLRSMPTFLKGPKQPPMRISLRKKIDDDPNLKGYRTFKEQNKAMEIAWKEELKNYENLLEVGGKDTKIIDSDDVSDLGDSEDEIEENLAAVSVGAAAAKKAQMDLQKMAEKQKENEGEGETKEEAAGQEDEKPAAEEVKPAEDNEKPEAEEKKEGLGDDDTAGGTLATAGGDINAPEDKPKEEEGSETPPEATVEEQKEADAAALEEVAKTGGDEDPDVDEGALPEEVKQEDLDKLLNKEAEDEGADTTAETSDHVEDDLAGVVEETLAAVGDEDGGSDDDDGEVSA